MYYWQTKTFKTKDAMQKWIERNSGKYQIVEIFINNGFALEYKRLRRIF